MSSPIRTTLLMGIIAAAVCGAAAFYYPHSDAAGGTGLGQNKGLYEAFEADRVWAIEIVRFNPDKQMNEKLSLQRRGDRWLIPAHASFPTDFVARRTAVLNALTGLTKPEGILEQRSDEQKDHIKYGVVDPAEFEQSGNRAGIGTRVTLEDKNRQTVASLIVGLPIEDDNRTGQTFVRIPGEPQVYLAEINPAILSVEFRDWVDSNLFGLRTQARPVGEPVSRITITSAAASAAMMDNSPASPSGSSTAWRGTVETSVAANGLILGGLEVFQNGKWVEAEKNSQVGRALTAAAASVAVLPVTDVRALPKETAENLLAGGPASADPVYAPLNETGIRQTAVEGQPLQFVSTGGRIEVETTSGLRLSMVIGNAFADTQSKTKLARAALFFAEVLPEKFPEPPAPTGENGADPTDEQQREYNRAVEARNEQLRIAAESAATFNRQRSRWLFVLDEEVIGSVIPTLDDLKTAETEPPTGSAAGATDAGSESPTDRPPEENSGAGQPAADDPGQSADGEPDGAARNG